MPSDFAITDGIRAWAAEREFADLEKHLDHFRDKALANGYRYADWAAAFKTAVRDDWAKLRTPTPAQNPAFQNRRPMTAHERHADLHRKNSDALAEWLATPPPASVVATVPAADSRGLTHASH